MEPTMIIDTLWVFLAAILRTSLKSVQAKKVMMLCRMSNN